MSDLPVLHPQIADLLEQASTAWPMFDRDQPTIIGHKGTSLTIEEALANDGYWGDPGTMSKSGVLVGPDSALKVSVVFACRRVISEDVAMMPIDLLEGAEGTRKRHQITDHPVARLINDAPNHWMSPFEFVEYMVATAAVHGSAYAYIHRDERGNPVELLPLLPGAVSVVQNQHWELTYTVSSGQQVIAEPEGSDLLKLHGPMHTPTAAFRVSQVAREAIGLAAAVEAAASRFHKNDLRPSGILISKGKLTVEQLSKLRTEWQSKFGPGGEGGIAVLDSDFDFKTLTATSVDSQTLENRKFQIEEICRFFRVIPIMIGHNNGSQGYNGLEQLAIGHVKNTLQPWVVRLEQAMKRDLLTSRFDRGLYIKLDMNELMRGTLGDRVTAYGNMVKTYATPNEIREREGMDPIDQPEMNRVQLLANNTGMAPGGGPKPVPAAGTPDSNPLLKG